MFYTSVSVINNSNIIQWGKISKVTSNQQVYTLNISCTIYAITATVRDATQNEYGIFINNYTPTAFSICCRGYNGGSLNAPVAYILIGSI